MIPGSRIFERHLAQDNTEPFEYIHPPFQFDASGVAGYPPEVTGYYLLNCLRRRLGWESFEGKKLLDFGCGVRFTRTIINLNIDIGVYRGADLSEAATAWLQGNIHDRHFRSVHLNVRDAWYRANEPPTDKTDGPTELGMTGFDTAWIFSLISHQDPNDASVTVAQRLRAVSDGGHLIFTAFTDYDAQGYIERDPDRPGLLSFYYPDLLRDLLELTGWDSLPIQPKLDNLQHTVFQCQAA